MSDDLVTAIVLRQRKERQDFIARIEALQAERDRLLPWARLGAAVMEGWPEYGDLDGWQLQDAAEKAGVLVEVPGGFDPEIHEDTVGIDVQPGDDWFMILNQPAVLASKEGGNE
jgi:hypothetical protein